MRVVLTVTCLKQKELYRLMRGSICLFLSFQSFDGGTDLTMKTYQQLTLTHYTAGAFDINVKIAYDVYSSKKGKTNLIQTWMS